MNKLLKAVCVFAATAQLLVLASCSSKEEYPTVLTSSSSIDTTLTKNGYDGPLMIADGGYSYNYPSNTAPALVAAFENGFDGVTVNVWESKSGELFVSESSDLSEAVGQSVTVDDLTEENRGDYPITSGKNIKKLGEVLVPTLDEALDVVSDYEGDVILNSHLSEKGVDKLIKLVEKKKLTENAVINNDGFTKFNTAYAAGDKNESGAKLCFAATVEQLFSLENPADFIAGFEADNEEIAITGEVNKTQYKYLKSLGVKYIISDHLVKSE